MYMGCVYELNRQQGEAAAIVLELTADEAWTSTTTTTHQQQHSKTVC